MATKSEGTSHGRTKNQPVQDEASESKAKRAREIFEEVFAAEEHPSRKQVVMRLVEELGLTENTASTYYQNWKSAHGYQDDSPSRRTQAMEYLTQMVEEDSEATRSSMMRALVEQFGLSENTASSYIQGWRKEHDTEETKPKKRAKKGNGQ